MTLRWRLSLALAAAVALGAIVFGVAARAAVEDRLYDGVDRELRGEVQRVLRDVARGGGIEPGRQGGEVRGPMGAGRPGAVFGRGAPFARVLDAGGNVVLQTTAAESLEDFPDPEVEPATRGNIAERTVRIDGERFRLVEASSGRGTLIVQVARPLDEVAGFLDTLMWVLAAAGAVALGAALLLGPWVARATLRPVERMTATTRQIASSPRDLSRRVEPAFPDPELREFADAMNEMLDSIDSADRHQRRFVADASHELRTPLTSLGGNATYLARSTGLDDESRDAVESVRRDVDRLTRIADGLTMLARLDASPVSQTEPCDVGDLARESVERIGRLYPDHRFEVAGTSGVHLFDVELVRRIVDNLVDNAGRYTPGGTTIGVTIGVSGDHVTIDVVDDGPGLSREERTQVVERFHRGSTSAGVSGTGLGLAIVDEAARALGGSLELHEAAPRGLHARVVLRSAARSDG